MIHMISHKKQGFTLSLKIYFSKNHSRGVKLSPLPPSRFRVKFPFRGCSITVLYFSGFYLHVQTLKFQSPGNEKIA